MLDPSLLSKFKGYEFKEQNWAGLFEPDILGNLKKKQCIFCSKKLHLLRNGTMYICSSRRCPQRITNGKAYVVSAGKVDRLST